MLVTCFHTLSDTSTVFVDFEALLKDENMHLTVKAVEVKNNV